MDDPADPSITQLLARSSTGDDRAADELYRFVYAHLRKLAHAQRRNWLGNETLGTTALVNELYLKLSSGSDFASRAHFFATASRAIRHILVNYAVEQRRAKRGGSKLRVPLDDIEVGSDLSATELIDLEEAVAAIEAENPRRARIVECRLFGGMSVEETAAAIGVSTATIKREWRVAKARLASRLDAD